MFETVDLEAVAEGEESECKLQEEEDPYKEEQQKMDFLLFQWRVLHGHWYSHHNARPGTENYE